MGPLITPGRFKIIGIAEDLPGRWLGVLDPVAQAIFPGISDRFFLGGEIQPHLARHIARTRPAHQRVDLAWRGGFEFQDPKLGPGSARLGRGPGGAVNSCGHFDRSRLDAAWRLRGFRRPYSHVDLLSRQAALTLVGAAGFEPAT
jgi:hypothetical protein